MEAALLDLWDSHRQAPPLARALALAVLGSPDETLEAMKDWSLGRRDRVLFDLREQLFGKEILGVADCPGCGALVEFMFETSMVRTEHASNDPFMISLEGVDGTQHRIELRAVTSRDLLAAPLDRFKLLERCMLSIDGAPMESSLVFQNEAKDEVVRECIRALGERDPQADVELQLLCEACNARWSAQFDIASYLWREIENWAMRTLREIHLLASAYGWTEHAILKLSSRRRRAYLQMVTSDGLS